MNTYVSQIHDNIKLNPTYETHKIINFLDLIITHKQTNFEIDTYRKPYTTDTPINFYSNHLIEYKMATFRFYISGMRSLPLNPEKKHKEWEITQTITNNNNFPKTFHHEINRQRNAT